MAGLFSNDDNSSDVFSRALYLVAGDLCEMGLSLIDLRGCPFMLRFISYQNDLVLLSSERKAAWSLSFRSLL